MLGFEKLQLYSMVRLGILAQVDNISSTAVQLLLKIAVRWPVLVLMTAVTGKYHIYVHVGLEYWHK